MNKKSGRDLPDFLYLELFLSVQKILIPINDPVTMPTTPNNISMAPIILLKAFNPRGLNRPLSLLTT